MTRTIWPTRLRPGDLIEEYEACGPVVDTRPGGFLSDRLPLPRWLKSTVVTCEHDVELLYLPWERPTVVNR